MLSHSDIIDDLINKQIQFSGPQPFWLQIPSHRLAAMIRRWCMFIYICMGSVNGDSDFNDYVRLCFGGSADPCVAIPVPLADVVDADYQPDAVLDEHALVAAAAPRKRYIQRSRACIENAQRAKRRKAAASGLKLSEEHVLAANTVIAMVTHEGSTLRPVDAKVSLNATQLTVLDVYSATKPSIRGNHAQEKRKKQQEAVDRISQVGESLRDDCFERLLFSHASETVSVLIITT